MNAVQQLEREGQSVWLDYIRRSLLRSGELKRMVEEGGLRGVTSNPKIFMKAITGSDEYDQQLKDLIARHPQITAERLYEAIAISDIQQAADVLRPVYDRSEGGDGFVSLEVSPRLAYDTSGTVAEAVRLWNAVDRPNLLIKVPATAEGIPAIELLLAQGINVNITLMFSLSHYEAVAQAYLRALKQLEHPGNVASVASFFISRITRAVDRALDEHDSERARALKGKIAIANAKETYRRFRELFDGAEFTELKRKGARIQRVLWASTSTKNPDYSDVLYVEELVGPDTVNTMPPATLTAFRDHGRVRGATIVQGLEEARAQLRELAELGIRLDDITEKLQEEGVTKFREPFEKLLETLEEKRRNIEERQIGHQTLYLHEVADTVDRRLADWVEKKFVRRLWDKDPTLWSTDGEGEIANRMGWLDLVPAMEEHQDELDDFASELKRENVRHLALIGMGGSSLAPEVFGRTFGHADGYPELIVLDSTHPAAITALDKAIDPSKTHFVVSSKSGTTMETLSLFRYFYDKLKKKKDGGHHFSAVTDPGTPLEKLAMERGFRHVFHANPDVGGRYSALSRFGLVPAAGIGMDIGKFLDRAWTFSESCAFCIAAPKNPALALGAALGELARGGRDKVTFVVAPPIAAFPAWVEQLIAESTGKNDRGLVPVVGEPLMDAEAYGADRVFIHLSMKDVDDGDVSKRLKALDKAGHPVIEIRLSDPYDLSQEMFRWEMAIAAAGAVIGINPFNQPNVELAKKLARDRMKGDDSGAGAIEELDATGDADTVKRALSNVLSQAADGDYVAIQAFLAPRDETTEILQAIRLRAGRGRKLATTLGYGPRFLHSTGQLHKGGPNTGVFLQIVDEPADAVPVPETDYTFRQLIRAQSRGDFQALTQLGRRVLRINVGADTVGGLERIARALG